MDKIFHKAVQLILELEGGYVNDPLDAGGKTKFGISQATFPDIDISSLTLESAIAIYRRSYWQEYSCGELPWPLALVLFDSVVQFNPLRPVIWLQVAVSATSDGKLGLQTISKANSCLDPVRAACQMMITRGEYRLTRPDYEYHGRGWRARDMTVLAEASRNDF